MQMKPEQPMAPAQPGNAVRDEENENEATAALRRQLEQVDEPASFFLAGNRVRPVANGAVPGAGETILILPPCPIEQLGDPGFGAYHGARYAYMAGSMAHGISSVALVIALGQAGFLASYGAGGVPPARVEQAIQAIQEALPHGPYAFNLIFNPNDPALERRAAELYVQHGVRTVEASAFLDITPSLVYYRAAGLSQAPDGHIYTGNRIIAKLSRKEVARHFMLPAPPDLLAGLVQEGKITPAQAGWAQHVPLADDITVEADSGGHTDNRPLVCLLPTMFALRDELQRRQRYAQPIRIGAGGGISTPLSAYGAFAMGAAYIVTGSINQSCVEAGASEHTRRLLAQADMADVTMAPAADMFEMGVRVQVLKRGTMFALRAQKLYELYRSYPSLDAIPPEERQKLEKTVFRSSLEEIWQQTEQFFNERDPSQAERGRRDPHYRMALVFRWYLGLSSHWSNRGEVGREMDYQVWCGPSMGAFNDWVRGAYLEDPHNRRVADVARQLLSGAAYLARLQQLKMHGASVPSELYAWQPQAMQDTPGLSVQSSII